MSQLEFGIGGWPPISTWIIEKRAMNISCDSQSTIFLANNPSNHSKNKHIDVQYNFIRDTVESNKVLLEKVEMLENIGDSLRKYVSSIKLS
jgi:hypothetical protein